MSTGVIVIIVVVVVIIVVALMFARPMRARARVKQRERELDSRRENVVSAHREEADVRTERAEAAEQRALIAAREAERDRAEAQLHDARAEVHEKGLADHELVADHERDHFAGTSAVADDDPDNRVDRTAGTRVPVGRDAAANGTVDRDVAPDDPELQRGSTNREEPV